MGELVHDARLENKPWVFADREEGARALAALLAPRFKGRKDAAVLAIPAGEVPVGRVLARELGLPFDLVFVRKLHFPDNPEAGFGAVGEGGEAILNPELAGLLDEETVARGIAHERKELAERVARLRKRPPLSLKGRTAILADDGLASGYTMLAAVAEARRRGASSVVVAVPTASERAVQRLLPEVEAVYVANLRRGPYFAVADAYRNWRDLGLDEVAAMLD